jgi:hypothetical protein
MKQIVLFSLIVMALVFVFVCTKDKTTNPPPREDPGYYYPRQKDYSWRYINLSPGCDAGAIHDSFDLTILRTNVRHGDVGFDRIRNADTSSITFLFVKADTLFAEEVGPGVPPPPYNMSKILVGPIRAGTFWKDQNFEYLIQGFENVTLSVTSVTYKSCARILITNRNHPEYNKVIEWWVPGDGEVREREVDSLDVCQRATELRFFSPTGVFP